MKSKMRMRGNGIIRVIIVIAIIGVLVFLAWKLGLFGLLGKGEGENNDPPTRQNIVTTEEQTDITTELTTVTTTETTALSSESTSETTTVTTEKLPVFIDVTVSGNGFTYQNRSYADTELQKLITELDAAVREAAASQPDTDALVRITDQEASLNAYKALTEKLDEVHIRYEEVKPE